MGALAWVQTLSNYLYSVEFNVVKVLMSDNSMFKCKGNDEKELAIYVRAWEGKTVEEISIYNKWGAMFTDKKEVQEFLEWLQGLKFKELYPDEKELEQWKTNLAGLVPLGKDETELNMDQLPLPFVMKSLWKTGKHSGQRKACDIYGQLMKRFDYEFDSKQKKKELKEFDEQRGKMDKDKQSMQGKYHVDKDKHTNGLKHDLDFSLPFFAVPNKEKKKEQNLLPYFVFDAVIFGFLSFMICITCCVLGCLLAWFGSRLKKRMNIKSPQFFSV